MVSWVAGLTRRALLDHPRRALESHVPSEHLSVVLPGGGLHVRVADPGADVPRRGAVLGLAADSADLSNAWHTGARKACARDAARFGGSPAPTLWDATFKSVPQRRGVTRGQIEAVDAPETAMVDNGMRCSRHRSRIDPANESTRRGEWQVVEKDHTELRARTTRLGMSSKGSGCAS